MAYTPLFLSEPFGGDVMTRECVRLSHDRFWYTILTAYYLESMADFYDKLEYDEETGVLFVVYDNDRHPIVIELIGAAMTVQCGYTMEHFPKGSQALQHWVEEIVPGA